MSIMILFDVVKTCAYSMSTLSDCLNYSYAKFNYPEKLWEMF